MKLRTKIYRCVFGYEVFPEPRGRVNEPWYKEAYEKAGCPDLWPIPGSKRTKNRLHQSILRGLFVGPKVMEERWAAKGEPIPTVSLRVFRGERENPFTGGKGVWVDPYMKDPETGLELLHEDQSPAKVVKES